MYYNHKTNPIYCYHSKFINTKPEEFDACMES